MALFNSAPLRFLLIVALVAGGGTALFSCGSDDDDDDDDGGGSTTNLTYSDVSTFINQHCASSSCHASGVQSPDLSTHAGVKANATASASRIENTTSPMPPAGTAEATSFASETDGKANLLEYLKGGAPE